MALKKIRYNVVVKKNSITLESQDKVKNGATATAVGQFKILKDDGGHTHWGWQDDSLATPAIVPGVEFSTIADCLEYVGRLIDDERATHE